MCLKEPPGKTHIATFERPQQRFLGGFCVSHGLLTQRIRDLRKLGGPSSVNRAFGKLLTLETECEGSNHRGQYNSHGRIITDKN
jgi:hypothetical protein